MKVIEHRWLLNNTKKYWSAVNFMSKHSQNSAIFDNAFQSQAGGPGVYMSMGPTFYSTSVTLSVWRKIYPSWRNNLCKALTTAGWRDCLTLWSNVTGLTLWGNVILE